ncbi:MAG: extracellular solute-binding protein, partial [Spirochaetales bacterium]|nr:extracellular solute-binding protein [Spirochaetales bacterium]
IGKEKGITVVPVFQGSYGDLKQKTTAAIKAGIAPTAAQAYPDWVAEYFQADIVVPLNDYIDHKEVGISDFDDILKAYRDENMQYTTEGIFFSLPFNKSTEVLFYNKTLFDANGYEPPETWAEVEVLAKKIFEKTGKPGFGFDSLANYFITLTRQYGGEYTDSQANIYFNQGDAAIKAIDLYKRNYEAGYWRIAGEDRYLSGPFNNEDVYMYVGSTAGSAYVGSDLFEWSSVPIPQVKGGVGSVIQQGTNVFLMNQGKTDEEVYAAYEYIKYLASKEASLYWTTHTGYLPTRQSVIDSTEYKAFMAEGTDSTKESGPAQGDFYFYDPGFYTSDFTSYDVRLAAGGAIDDALLNGVDAKTAVENAYKKFQ